MQIEKVAELVEMVVSIVFLGFVVYRMFHPEKFKTPAEEDIDFMKEVLLIYVKKTGSFPDNLEQLYEPIPPDKTTDMLPHGPILKQMFTFINNRMIDDFYYEVASDKQSATLYYLPHKSKKYELNNPYEI